MEKIKVYCFNQDMLNEALKEFSSDNSFKLLIREFLEKSLGGNLSFEIQPKKKS